MSINKQLENFRKYLHQNPQIDNNFINKYAIELYDLIHDNKELKLIFYNNADYLVNLQKKKNYKKLEKDIFSLIQETLKYFSSRRINTIKVKYWSRIKSKHHEENNDLSYKEIIKRLKDERFYYHLGDSGYNVMGKELSVFNPTLPILNQYEMIYNLIKDLLKKIPPKKISDRNEVGNNIKRLDTTLQKLHLFLHRETIKRHVYEHEHYLIFCYTNYPQKNHEDYYKVFQYIPEKNRDVKQIIHNITTVINDLIKQYDLNTSKNKTKIKELEFYNGLATYGNLGKAYFTPGTQTYELLNLLYNSKNMSFSLDDIKKHCNTNLNTPFSDNDSVKYTIKDIKDKLKLKEDDRKGFPIRKTSKGWLFS